MADRPSAVERLLIETGRRKLNFGGDLDAAELEACSAWRALLLPDELIVLDRRLADPPRAPFPTETFAKMREGWAAGAGAA